MGGGRKLDIIVIPWYCNQPILRRTFQSQQKCCTKQPCILKCVYAVQCIHTISSVVTLCLCCNLHFCWRIRPIGDFFFIFFIGFKLRTKPNLICLEKLHSWLYANSWLSLSRDLNKRQLVNMAQGFKPSKAGSSSKGKTISSTRTKTGPKRGREYCFFLWLIWLCIH